MIKDMERYVTYSGFISMDKNEFPDIPLLLDTIKVQDTIFLREIYVGKYASLFAHSDKLKKRFFVSEPGSSPIELEYHQYYSSDRTATKQSALYKNQLYNIAGKHQLYHIDVTGLLNTTLYKEQDLEKFFRKINPDTKPEKQHKNYWYYAGVGIDRTRTTFGSQFMANDKYNNVTYSPRFNIGLEVSNNPNVQRFIFRVELSFWYTKFSDSFNQYALTVSPQILWNIYNTDKLKYFIGGGLGFNFTRYTNSTTPYLPESSWANYPLTTGVVLNRQIEIALIYTLPATYSKLGGLYFENQTTSLGVKYRFGKK